MGGGKIFGRGEATARKQTESQLVLSIFEFAHSRLSAFKMWLKNFECINFGYKPPEYSAALFKGSNQVRLLALLIVLMREF
jgi:hypothetical protein